MGEDVHTELRHAAIAGNVDACKQLLDSGAKVNSTNQHQNTALHYAAQHGHPPVVELLIGNKADLNATNTNGQTPLQVACMKGQLDIVKILIDNGSKPDLQTEYTGFTALHFASNAGYAEICQYLLDCGATEETEDFADQIAEFYAANEPTEEVFRKRKNTRPKTPQKPKTPTQKVKTPPKPETPPTKPKTPPQKPKTPPSKQEAPPTKEEARPTKEEAPPTKEETPTTTQEASPTMEQAPPRSKTPPPKLENPPSGHETSSKTSKSVDRGLDEQQNKPKDADGRKRDAWMPKRNKIKIVSDLNYNFQREGMKFDYKKRDGNTHKLKNHEFEWSEEYKARAKQSVFDRLGGAKKKTEPEAGQKGAKK